MNWYYFPYHTYSGQENMAFDHALATRFSELKHPIIRFFGWKTPTLSLGFHQKKEAIDTEKLRDDGYELVRRPTGGRAIFHARELTYSIVVPASMISKTELYKKVHEAFIRGFIHLGLGVELNRSQANLGAFYKTKESVSCFSASAKYEAAFQGKKFIGSAQRAYPEAVLQHGSIMLSEDYLRLLDYSKLSSKEYEKALENLREKTFFWNVYPMRDKICETLLDELKLEFEITEFIVNPFNPLEWDALNEWQSF